MKPLTLEETRLKEEMKHECFWDNIHYKNPEAKKTFNLICHLEDFELQYWELQQKNEQLKIQIRAREEKYRKLEDKYKELDKMCELYSKSLYNAELNQYKDNWNKLKEYFNERIEVCDNRLSSPFCNFEKATKERLIFSQCLEKLEELEGSDSK